MTDVCRLCASVKSMADLVHIQDPNICLESKLMRCCQIVLSNEPLLPQSVCEGCIQHLEASWKFAEMVSATQEHLKQDLLVKVENLNHDNENYLNNEESVTPNFYDNHQNFNSIKESIKSTPNELLSIQTSPPIKRRKFLHIKNSIMKYYLEGLSADEITNKLRINKRTTTRWLKIFKIEQERQLKEQNVFVDVMPMDNVNNKTVEDIKDQNKKISIEEAFVREIDNTNKSIMEIDDFHLETFIYKDPENERIESVEESRNESDLTDEEDSVGIRSEQYDDENNIELSDHDLQSLEENILSDFDLVILDETDKNPNGVINESGLKKIDISWATYPWKCSECDIVVENVSKLREHCNEKHKMPLRSKCIDCSKIFSKYLTFINHVRKRHRPILKYCCDICSVYFWNLKALFDHRSEHSKCSKYNCFTCNKFFRNSNTLQTHLKSHLIKIVKNRFTCDICMKKFATKPNLLAHKRIHLGVREYTCEHCGKSFIQKGNLDNHVLTHVSVRPYSCELCKKSFKTQLRLNNHKTVHSGEKPHKCNECGREFREKGTLREHLRIHSGAMPFSCDFCDKKFRFKGVLTTHRRQHTGERPYSCLDCNHHFANWPNYNKHMKRRHGINTSVTVRKPQAIPPSGMPPRAKLNHIVPTPDNMETVENSIVHNMSLGIMDTVDRPSVEDNENNDTDISKLRYNKSILLHPSQLEII